MTAQLELRGAAGPTPLWRLSVADSWLSRLRGLIGRSSLPEGTGLYLPGTNSIHMLFMRFPIDCLFVGPANDDGWRRVVDIRRRVRPWIGVVWWVRHAKGAVELTAGAIEASGMRVGDYVRVRILEAVSAQPPASG